MMINRLYNVIKKQMSKEKKQDADKSVTQLQNYLSRVTKRPALFFDVEVTDHCNLNCKSCGSFAPIAKKRFIDVQTLEKDCERLSNLSGGVCHHINVLGGEPLLHPEITRILKIVRSYFPVGSINLVTNGSLLMKQDEEFWETCRNGHIVIAPTHYPIDVDYAAIMEKAKQEKCEYVCYGDPAKYWCKTTVDELAQMNEVESFINCSNANNCSVLIDGKLYMCPKPAKIHIINEKFGTSFPVTTRDYIDIYQAESLDEIMEFLSNPIPFCKYCKKWERIEWGISKHTKEEWLK